jgi:hypothetical protein
MTVKSLIRELESFDENSVVKIGCLGEHPSLDTPLIYVDRASVWPHSWVTIVVPGAKDRCK